MVPRKLANTAMENPSQILVLDGKNPNVFCIQLLRCVDPLLFINNIPYFLIRWIAVITLSVNSTCYDITGKNYSATHCLLLFAIKAGDLLDSVKKASINCSKQTIEAFSFDIIAILINNAS